MISHPASPRLSPHVLGYIRARTAARWPNAELRLGPGIIMLGSQRADAPSAGEVIPRVDAGGKQFDFARIPFALYVAVDDPDAHCERSRAAGAEIAELHDTFYGSREYSARDLEGNVWTFGTYHPAAGD